MPSTLEQMWSRTLKKIEQSHYFNDQDFKAWISKTTLFRIENNIAYIAYRSSITKAIMEQQLSLFESTLSEELPEPVKIRLVEQKEMEQMLPEVAVQQKTNTLLANKFNPTYTFENFIEGNSNQERRIISCVQSIDAVRQLRPGKNPPSSRGRQLSGSRASGEKSHLYV